MITIQTEKLADLYPEILPLYERHYQEIAENKDSVPLDPDYERYLAMDKSGMLLVVTVRDDDKLVGYFKVIIVSLLHYRSTLSAETDIFFIDKEYRGDGTGTKLFRFVIEEVEKRGAKCFYSGYKIKHGHEKLFKSLGFVDIERRAVLYIEDQV